MAVVVVVVGGGDGVFGCVCGCGCLPLEQFFNPRKSYVFKSSVIILFFIIQGHVACCYGKECRVSPLWKKDDGVSYLILSTLYLYLYLLFSSLRNETFGFRSVFVRKCERLSNVSFGFRCAPRHFFRTFRSLIVRKTFGIRVTGKKDKRNKTNKKGIVKRD